MKLLVGKKLIAVVALAVLLLIIISAVSRGSGARLLATAGWVTHTHETVAKLETMSHWIERAETAQRDGFSIHSREYYHLVLDLLQPRGMASLLLAHHEGDLLAGGDLDLGGHRDLVL